MMSDIARSAVDKACNRIYNDLVLFFEKKKHQGDVLKGLFDGQWGAVLYMFYYEHYCDNGQNNAVKYLLDCYEDTGLYLAYDYRFCTGLSGSFWVLHHLNKYNFLELNIEEISADFITGAIAQSNRFIADGNFDFLHGSAGICNLLTAFAHRDDVRVHLAFWVNSIMQQAVQMKDGVSLPFFYYHTEPASRPGVDAFSLAHGTCALQIVLIKIHREGIEQEKCRHIIRQSMQFILQYEKAESDSDSLFPAYLKGKSPNSRLSWCYGDLNVAISLWQSGKYFNDGFWMKKAIDVFKYNTKRIGQESSGVVDICLCHGTAGNAAMYMRMWQETQEQSMFDAAMQWYELTAQMLQFSVNDEMHGVQVCKGNDQWEYNWNLLQGSAGVGLALLNQLQNKALPWDELMLMS